VLDDHDFIRIILGRHIEKGKSTRLTGLLFFDDVTFRDFRIQALSGG
jgi:hypothetical protein